MVQLDGWMRWPLSNGDMDVVWGAVDVGTPIEVQP